MQIKEKFYYPYFDYLRIILASIVMFGHDGLISWKYSGKLAVDVFFALSGWLIGSILIRIEVKKLSRFYFNRALRIWVPYYITFIFIILASLLKDPINLKWFEFVGYKLTWVYNIFGTPQLQFYKEYMPLNGTGNHFWSINAEEQFYLLAPLLLVVFAKNGRKLITWGLIATFFWFTKIYAPMSLGVLAAIANSKYPDFHIKKFNKLLIWIIFLCSSIGLYVASDYKLYSPFFAISLVLILAVKGKKNVVGSFLGGISYPLYLNHWIGVFLFHLILKPFYLHESWIYHLCATLSNYAIAAILYWYIDRNIINMREQLYTAKKGVIFTIIAYISINIGLIFGYILNPSIYIAITLCIFLITASIIITVISKQLISSKS